MKGVRPRWAESDAQALSSLPHAGSKAKGGGVRFAPSQPTEGAHGHVHFDEKLHDSVVMVTQEKDGSFLVKVGAGTWELRGVPVPLWPVPAPGRGAGSVLGTLWGGWTPQCCPL